MIRSVLLLALLATAGCSVPRLPDGASLGVVHTLTVALQDGAVVYDVEGEPEAQTLRLPAGGDLAVSVRDGLHVLVVAARVPGETGSGLEGPQVLRLTTAIPSGTFRSPLLSAPTAYEVLVFSCAGETAGGRCVRWEPVPPSDGSGSGLRLLAGGPEAQAETRFAPDPPLDPDDQPTP